MNIEQIKPPAINISDIWNYIKDTFKFHNTLFDNNWRNFIHKLLRKENSEIWKTVDWLYIPKCMLGS